MSTDKRSVRATRPASIAAWTCAALALIGACRSRDERASPASPAVGATAAVARSPAPMSPPPGPGAASAAREITVEANGQPWVRIGARGETVTVVTEGVSLVGQAREDGKRRYAPADGGAVVVEVKPRAPDDADPGDMTVGFKLRGPDGKLLWKVKAGPTKIKVASDEEGARAFVVSAKHPTEAVVLGPDGVSLGRVHAMNGSKDLRGEDATGGELFRTATDLPPAWFGALLFQGMPTRDRALIVAELATRMAAQMATTAGH